MDEWQPRTNVKGKKRVSFKFLFCISFENISPAAGELLQSYLIKRYNDWDSLFFHQKFKFLSYRYYSV